MNHNILSENSQPERIANARFLVALSELQDHIVRVEAKFADVRTKLAIFEAEDEPDDHLDRLHRQILADADPFGIGPAGPVPSLSEAFECPTPHIGERRADALIDQVASHTLSYADHARNWVS